MEVKASSLWQGFWGQRVEGKTGNCQGKNTHTRLLRPPGGKSSSVHPCSSRELNWQKLRRRPQPTKAMETMELREVQALSQEPQQQNIKQSITFPTLPRTHSTHSRQMSRPTRGLSLHRDKCLSPEANGSIPQDQNLANMVFASQSGWFPSPAMLGTQ